MGLLGALVSGLPQYLLRASFIVAMVKPQERGSAAGVTSLARVIPFGVSPTLSAYLMQNLSLSLPLFIGGSLQLAHDLSFLSIPASAPRPKSKWLAHAAYRPVYSRAA